MRTSQASMVTDATEGETYQYEMRTGEEDTHLHYSSRSASEWQSELRSGKRPPWLGGVDVVHRASGGYRTSKGLGSGIARMHTLASRVHTCTSPLGTACQRKLWSESGNSWCAVRCGELGKHQSIRSMSGRSIRPCMSTCYSVNERELDWHSHSTCVVMSKDAQLVIIG